MCFKDVSVSRRSGLLGWFLGARDLVFFNYFWVGNSLCAMKISTSAVELGFLDDFLGPKEPVFVNAFSINKSPCAKKMSASAVEMGFLHDFLVPKDLVFINGFWASRSLCALKIWASAAELGSMMISGSALTHFSSMVSQSAVVYVRWRCQRQA